MLNAEGSARVQEPLRRSCLVGWWALPHRWGNTLILGRFPCWKCGQCMPEKMMATAWPFTGSDFREWSFFFIRFMFFSRRTWSAGYFTCPQGPGEIDKEAQFNKCLFIVGLNIVYISTFPTWLTELLNLSFGQSYWYFYFVFSDKLHVVLTNLYLLRQC